MVTFGSLFSGCGLMDLGLERAGLHCRWMCEIDPDARRVLTKHWPAPPCHTDVRKLRAQHLSPVDVLVGGFPCQDLSVAGQRGGLVNGQRSGLWWEMLRVIRIVRPQVVLWENVPGLLSSDKGRDFARVCSSLAKHRYFGCVRTLDARYFGVAQRRRRLFGVFVRGDSTARRAAQILAVREGRSRNPPQGREAGKDVATTLRSRSHRPGVSAPGRGGEDDENLVTYHANGAGSFRAGSPSLSASDDNGSSHLVAMQCHGSNVGPMGTLRQGNGNVTGGVPFVTGPITAGISKSLRGSEGIDSDWLVTHALASEAAGMMVRRLTPTECLRLMGAPDDWLDVDPPLSDSAKYHLCGNGVVVSVAAWIGRRILESFA